MNRTLPVVPLLILLTVAGLAAAGPQYLTELRLAGYSLIPAPQLVELAGDEVVVDRSWKVEAPATAAFAASWLAEKAHELHGLGFRADGSARIVLRITPGAVGAGPAAECADQAYRLRIAPGLVEISGNSPAGLFHGVQSLLQLLRPRPSGGFSLPAGTITDWPDLKLRFVHWDTKHHQLRPEALHRLIDWLALFKVNAVGFELEDKYEYPRHPVIGAPGAYTKAEMQELTGYALERGIQLVPVIQSPAHMAYVLKHPEFAHLRADGSNYQACMCDPAALELIFDMYRDMIEATPGVEYFHVSTDEIYYAGICDKCQKQRPYNDQNRSLAWAEFAVKAHEFLKGQGRRMLAWVEYPLLPEHIAMLPPDLINGVMGSDPEFLDAQRKIGMRQLAYTSMQGAELLFPNYLPADYRGRRSRGRVEEAAEVVRLGLAQGAQPIGSFAAFWDDSGLHEETAWLGWVTVTQYAWSHRFPTPEQTIADFMDVFYGPAAPELTEAYRLLIEGARFFEEGWDQVESTERPRAYGNSSGKGIGGQREDLKLDPPPLPAPDRLGVEPVYGGRYRELAARARAVQPGNDRLVELLQRALTRVDRNRYNLEVLLSIAGLERSFIRTVLELEAAEQSLVAAAGADARGDHGRAVAHLVEAGRQVRELEDWSAWNWSELTRVWEKSRYPKGQSVDGREFLHVMDDVKDHFADRRPGLDYMQAPFQRIGLPQWRKELAGIIRAYAARHGVPVRALEEVRLED